MDTFWNSWQKILSLFVACIFIPVTAAAGNYGLDSDTTPIYPTSYALSNIISVAALDTDDTLASFSNYGKTSVDIAAPGVNILSTLPGNNYGLVSGTSFSAPMVAAVLAVLPIAGSDETASLKSQLAELFVPTTYAAEAEEEMTLQEFLNLLFGSVQSWTELEGKVKGGKVLRFGETPIIEEEEEVIPEDDVSLQKAIETINESFPDESFEFFDKEIYYNLDDTPKYQVFTFHWSKKGETSTKQQVIDMVQAKYEEEERLGEQIEAYKAAWLKRGEAGEEIDAVEYMRGLEELKNKGYRIRSEMRGHNAFEAIWLTMDLGNPQPVRGGGLPPHYISRPFQEALIKDSQFEDYSLGRFYYEEKWQEYFGLLPPDYQLSGKVDDPPFLMRSHDSTIYSRDNLEAEKEEVLVKPEKAPLWHQLLRFVISLLPLL